ncbi:MAG TPA: endolytic transglycosylase MltG [Steroidobacteraceae bacterium]|nr:endolytic transglycosylase MltG [Steroidobacteraceae bacterium]
MRRLLKIFVVVLVLVALGAGALVWWSNKWLQQPIAALQQDTTFEVPRGASLRSVATALSARGVLDEPQVWVAWARLTRRDGVLKAGEYQLQPGLTPRSLLTLLSSGQVLLHSITFIEGSTFADLRNALLANDAVLNENAKRSDADIMRALGEPDGHPEGQFFPDTYRFPRGTSDLELLTIAHRRMQDELQKAWDSRAPDLPLANAYEALVLASIVEKETALERERAQIAGVFVERLRRGMRLQTDPTVIYGMGLTYDGNIRRADLSRDTPYNTYTRPGLPPTPIAMPSRESLQAAVHPDVSGALFFVATGAGDGSHYFSKTLAEHNLAVKRYLRELRRR